jgi:alpha-beta hydrolase superfamily lysophospholipase
MTFRVERSAVDDAVVLVVSGDIAGDHTADLETLVDTGKNGPIVLDLKDVSIVDRAGVLLLARSEGRGATLLNCPSYVREWIHREKEFADSEQRAGGVHSEGHSMTTGVAIGAHEETLENHGLKIFFRSWRPPTTARGAVVVVPGFNSHSGYYAWVAQRLAAVGQATYAIDLRGRGRSDGERFYVDTFVDYVSDIASLVDLVRSRNAGLPVFLLGHSAGGVLACLYTLDHPSALAGLICESFAFQTPAPDFALAVLKGLSHVAPHAHVLRLKNEDFSRDPQTVSAMNNDPLIAHETQPTKTVAELVRSDERLKEDFGHITLPLLILHGTEDKAAKSSGSQLFYDRAGSTDKTLKLYDGHVHDLLNDLGKETVMADITAWIGARLPGGAQSGADDRFSEGHTAHGSHR